MDLRASVQELRLAFLPHPMICRLTSVAAAITRTVWAKEQPVRTWSLDAIRFHRVASIAGSIVAHGSIRPALLLQVDFSLAMHLASMAAFDAMESITTTSLC